MSTLLSEKEFAEEIQKNTPRTKRYSRPPAAYTPRHRRYVHNIVSNPKLFSELVNDARAQQSIKESARLREKRITPAPQESMSRESTSQVLSIRDQQQLSCIQKVIWDFGCTFLISSKLREIQRQKSLNEASRQVGEQIYIIGEQYKEQKYLLHDSRECLKEAKRHLKQLNEAKATGMEIDESDIKTAMEDVAAQVTTMRDKHKQVQDSATILRSLGQFRQILAETSDTAVTVFHLGEAQKAMEKVGFMQSGRMALPNIAEETLGDLEEAATEFQDGLLEIRQSMEDSAQAMERNAQGQVEEAQEEIAKHLAECGVEPYLPEPPTTTPKKPPKPPPPKPPEDPGEEALLAA